MNSMVNHVAAAVGEDLAPSSIAGGASARLLEIARVVDSAPLTAEDVGRLFTLRKIVECDLARRATPLMRSLDLERLGRNIQLLGESYTNMASATSAYESFILGLLWPAASNTELHTVRSLITALGRSLGSEVDRSWSKLAELKECRRSLRRLLGAFQTGDPDLAEAALLHHLDAAERLTVRLTLTGRVSSTGRAVPGEAGGARWAGPDGSAN